MSAIIEDAPAAAASESPDPAPATTTRVGHSEATLVACALTKHVHRLFGVDPDLVEHVVHRMVQSALGQYSHAEVLDWHNHVPEGEYKARWEAARTLTKRFYPELPGADALPEYEKLPALVGV